MIAARKLAVVAGLVAACLVGPATRATAADPTMTVSATTVAVGGSIDVTVDQCDLTEDPQAFGDRAPQVLLLVGSGAGQQRAATGIYTAPNTYRITVPGWVDPAEPAVVVGTCFRTDFGPGSGFHWNAQFSYPDVAIDVTPPAAPVPFASFAPARSALESGQLLVVDGNGCDPGGDVRMSVTPLAGFDPRDHLDPTIVVNTTALDADGSFHAEAVLNDPRSLYLDDDDVPLAVGSYLVSVGCFASDGVWYFAPGQEAQPQTIEVTASNPTDSTTNGWTAANVDRRALSGEGCTGGRTVSVQLTAHSTQGSSEVASATVTPAADGTWTYLWSADGLPKQWRVLGDADCGDPAADGFRYVSRTTFAIGPAELEVTSAQPSTTEAGSDLVAVVVGRCPGVVDAVLADDTGAVVATSGPIAGNGAENTYRLNLTAPETPGSYRLLGRCSDVPGAAVDYVVTSVGLQPPPAVPIPGTAGYTG